MKQPEINTMVLGQTGVGKSSLINYLYGADVVRTGTGKPVTGRGDFTKISVPSPFKSDVKINIFDSWGLESDKAEDWEAVIDEKLNAKLSFDEMIYAIVYCSSYANHIQDFEIRTLKKLLSKQYKVTIALTNADNSGFETKKKVYRERFAKELAEYRDNYSVVDICSLAKPKLGQSAASARTFGKEELFRELERDFLINFVNLVYVRWTAWKEESFAKLKGFRRHGMAVIEDFEGGYFDTNDDRMRQIADHLKDEMETLASGIQEKIQGEMKDIKTWYKQAAGAFYRVNLSDNFWFKLLNYTLIFFPDKLDFKRQRKLKDQLIKQLDEAVRRVEDKIRENYRIMENFRKDLKRGQREKNA